MGLLHWSKDFALWQWHSIFIIIHYKDLLCHHIQWELQVGGFTNGERTVIFLCCRVESPWLFIPFFEMSYLLQRWHFKAVSTGTRVFWEKKMPFSISFGLLSTHKRCFGSLKTELLKNSYQPEDFWRLGFLLLNVFKENLLSIFSCATSALCTFYVSNTSDCAPCLWGSVWPIFFITDSVVLYHQLLWYALDDTHKTPLKK